MRAGRGKVINCRVRGCPNKRRDDAYNRSNGISFHAFPRNPHTRIKWVEFCDNDEEIRPEIDETKSRLSLCSWHFPEDQFHDDGRCRLAFNGIVPTLRPPPPRNQSSEGADQLEDSAETGIVYSNGPPPPPRIKEKALKIINIEADPFPSLHTRTIAPKSTLIPVPGNQYLPQNLSQQMLVVPSSSLGSSGIVRSSTNNTGLKGKLLVSQKPGQRVILPAKNVLPPLVPFQKSKAVPASASVQSAVNKPIIDLEKTKAPESLKEDAKPSVIYCPEKKTLVMKNTVPISTTSEVSQQSSSSAKPVNVETKNVAGKIMPNQRVLLVKEGNDKSARLILKVMGPSHTGTTCLKRLVSAAIGKDKTPLAGKSTSTNPTESGDAAKHVPSTSGVAPIKNQDDKVILIEEEKLQKSAVENQAEEEKLQKTAVENHVDNPDVPIISDIRSLKETSEPAEKRVASPDLTEPMAKKLKPDDSNLNQEKAVKQGKSICNDPKNDSDYKKGPDIPGLKPFCPVVTENAISKQLPSATQHYLYFVSSSEKWKISHGTYLAFDIEALDSLLSKSGPNILAKSAGKVYFLEQLFNDVRKLARALFIKGVILNQKTFKKVMNNEPVLPNTDKLPEKFVTGNNVPFYNVEESDDEETAEALPNLQFTTGMNISSASVQPPNFDAYPKPPPGVRWIAPSPAKMFPIIGTLSQFPGSLANVQPTLLAPGTVMAGTPQSMVMLPSGALVPALPPATSTTVEKTQALPSSLQIPAYVINQLKRRLPLLVGKEGVLRVTKSNFNDVIKELDEMGYETTSKGQVLKKKPPPKKPKPPPEPTASKNPDDGRSPYALVEGKDGAKLKKRADIVYAKMTHFRRSNLYLKKQLERLKNKPLSKAKKKEITIETMKEVFTKDQFAFFLSQFANASRGNGGQRYDPEFYKYCSSIFLESRRVYRKLRQTFVLPEEKSLAMNVPNPQYFTLPKKKQWKKRSPEEIAAAKEAAAAAAAAEAISGVPKKRRKRKTVNELKSLNEIVQEATGEETQDATEVTEPTLQTTTDFSGLVENLLQTYQDNDVTHGCTVVLSLPQL